MINSLQLSRCVLCNEVAEILLLMLLLLQNISIAIAIVVCKSQQELRFWFSLFLLKFAFIFHGGICAAACHLVTLCFSTKCLMKFTLA